MIESIREDFSEEGPLEWSSEGLGQGKKCSQLSGRGRKTLQAHTEVSKLYNVISLEQRTFGWRAGWGMMIG